MVEDIILMNLAGNEEYTARVIPFLVEEYFDDAVHKMVFEESKKFIDSYSKCPTQEVLKVEIGKRDGINEDLYKRTIEYIDSMQVNRKTSLDWLISTTEKFCQDKAIVNAIRKSITIIDGQDKKLDKGVIPNLLQEALGVSFNTSVGHNYLADAEKRFEFYHDVKERIPFDIDLFNEITHGGLPNKTLTVMVAGTNVGKSFFMCHFAAANLMLGKKVLYITLEMAEEMISQRIDMNLMNVTSNDLAIMPKKLYEEKIKKIRGLTKGNLIVKEYPNGTAGAAHFNVLLNELKLKKNFVPDIIYVDYLNLCMSTRYKRTNTGMYEYYKSIAEELRALGQQHDLPVVTATQLNRTGYASSDPGLEHTAESFGVPYTADLMFGAVRNKELDDLNQILCILLKSRLNSSTQIKTFVVGADIDKMKLYNLEASAQKGLTDGPLQTINKEINKDKFSQLIVE